MTPLARTLEALLFLAPDPVSLKDLADATGAWEDEVTEALGELRHHLDGHGVALREVGGGFTLAAEPAAEEAARRLLGRAAHAVADPRAGRDAVDRRLPAAGLASRDRAHPRRRLGVGDHRAGSSAA